MDRDSEDLVTIALDFATQDLARLARRLVDPTMVWERWWAVFTAGLVSPMWTLEELDAYLLAVTRKVRSELLSSL